MTNLKNIMKTDFSRAFISLRFPLAVFLMYLVWDLNSKRFGNPEDVLYLFIHTWARSITYLLAMAVSAVVYTTSYCEDIEHNFLRYSILRTSVSKYVLSKVLTCFCGAFCTVFLGTIIFLTVKCLTLPLTAPESIAILNFQSESCFGNLLSEHTMQFLLLQTTLNSLACGGLSALALAFSTFIKNSYGVFAIPFLLHYCFFYLFDRISTRYPIFSVYKIFDCVNTYTNNSVFFLFYAFFVTFIFMLSSYGIMYRKVKGDFQ